MADGTFSKEQVAALEKVLGVKLPEQGFTLEIKPAGSELSVGQLDSLVGGSGVGSVHTNQPLQQAGLPQVPMLRWSCKI